MAYKSILFTLFLLLSTSYSQIESITFNYPTKFLQILQPDPFQALDPNLLAFTEGFLTGIGSAHIFDHLRACLSNSEAFTNDIITAFTLFKTMTPSSVKTAIQYLGEAAQIIPIAAKNCKATEADIQTLTALVDNFRSPCSFMYHVGKSLVINRVEVLSEIEGAFEGYAAHNYTQLGYWVGKAMDTVVFNVKMAALRGNEEIEDFVEGFLDGVGMIGFFGQVRECIGDSEGIMMDVMNAMEDIETKDPVRVKEGIELLGEAVEIVPNAFYMCKVGLEDLKTLVKMAETFKSPTSFMYHVGKSMIINNVEVISEISNAVAGYEASNFTDLGYWIGKAMDTILLGHKKGLSQNFVDFLNENSGWEAEIPKKFEGMTILEIKSQFLGANLIENSQYQNLTVYNYEGVKDIPASFNAMDQWPGCIHPIRDQGHCGSCWAFAASEVLSDRFCIASNGSVNVVLSPQYLLSCDDILDHGCNGGNPLHSWWMIDSMGLITEECLPYQSYNGTQPVNCNDVKQCQDGSPLKKYYSKWPAQFANPASIQANLMQFGPVEASFQVYQDFMYYKGGIYKHVSGDVVGGHAVKIVGWGNESGTNYWIIANSWGEDWGEQGFFRIAFGQCGIDSSCIAGEANLAKSMTTEARFW